MGEVGLLFQYPPQIILLVLLHGTTWYHTVIINYLRDANLRELKDIQKIQDREQRKRTWDASKENVMTRFKIINWLRWPVVIILVDIFILLGRIFASYTSKNLLFLDIVIVGIFAVAQIIFFFVFLCSYFPDLRRWFQKDLKKYEPDCAEFIKAVL